MSAAFSPLRLGILAAFGVAAAMLLAAGARYRALAGELGRGGQAALVRTEDLARVPMSIGAWRGRDEPIDKNIAAYTDADALLCRVYTRGGQTVVLYVAGGVRARDMMPHRPGVCYPSHGWMQEAERPIRVTLADGSVLPCQVFMFGKGGLSTRTVKVLNYYIIDGQYGADVSALRKKAMPGSSHLRYLAQVQLSCTVAGGSARDGQELLEEFIAQAGPLVLGVMPGQSPSTPSASAPAPARAGEGGP